MWYIVVVLAIFAYGYVLRRRGAADVLEQKVVDDPSVPGFDGWGATHLFFWAFLGFLYPNHYVGALVVSLVWEGVEDVLGRNRITVGGSRLQLVGDTDEDGQVVKADAADADGGFWYGRYTTDPFFNLAGYVLGSAAANKWWPSTPCRARVNAS